MKIHLRSQILGILFAVQEPPAELFREADVVLAAVPSPVPCLLAQLGDTATRRQLPHGTRVRHLRYHASRDERKGERRLTET